MSSKRFLLHSKFKQVCRTCLSKKHLQPLYGTGANCPADLLVSFTGLKFSEDDGLPARICKICTEKLNQTFLFLNWCKTTDTYLRNQMKYNIESVQSQQTEQIEELDEKIKTDDKPENPIPNVDDAPKNIQQRILDIIKSVNVTKEYQYDEPSNDPVDKNDAVDLGEIKNEADPESEKTALLPNQSQINDFPCTKCDQTFTQEILLLQHSAIHDANGYLCIICGRWFIDEKYLNIHAKLHRDRNLHKCPFCEKKFIQIRQLNVHKLTHKGVQPHVCAVCKKAFPIPSELKEHVKLHNGEKLFMCEYCGRKFFYASSLRDHIRIHTGEKPFRCDICDKAFIRKNDKKIHQRIHTGEKPYICYFCKKPFADYHGLARHNRIHMKQGR